MRWMLAVWALTSALALAAGPDAPQEYKFGAVRIDRLFARATPPGAKTAAVYLTIDNAGATDRLLRASTPIAGGVVLHQMVQKGGMMTMRAVPSLEIIQGGKLELEPGGYHLMLIDLKQPLKSGERFPLTLAFEHLGTVNVMVRVEDMGATPARR